jgi:hypothetical protein
MEMKVPTTAKFVSAVLTAGLLAIACPMASAERATPTRVVKCEGPFGRNATHADLVKAFGSDNVVYREVEGVDGKPIKASVVYPNDPKARLEVNWGDEKARRGPTVLIKDQSAWVAANGIRIGTELAEVEKLNGKPFKLSGFDWDYGGHVRDWQGGALAKPQPGGCIVAVEFVHPEDAPEESLTKVTGDIDVLSDSADLRAVEPYVGLLLIAYPPR